MSNGLGGIGRGRISGGYQGPVVLPAARKAGGRSSSQSSSGGSGRALVPVNTPAEAAADIAFDGIQNTGLPAIRSAEAVIEGIDISGPGLKDGADFVIMDGRRYNLNAPRGTYYNFLV